MIAILGTTGMLGGMVKRIFQEAKQEIICINKKDLDVSKANVLDIRKKIPASTEWIINCIGLLRPYIDESNKDSIENAIKVNTIFPYELAKTDKKIIQIATDCVFFGNLGRYKESDVHDPIDVYGKTKSLGEVKYSNFFNIRCSIIGPEQMNHLSLLDWFRSQKGLVNGYNNHWWNGVTTLAFAKLCLGIIKNDYCLPSLQHFIPTDIVTKAQLLKIIAEEYHLDIKINEVEVDNVDTSLGTNDYRENEIFWKLAGYRDVPSIKELVGELYAYTS